MNLQFLSQNTNFYGKVKHSQRLLSSLLEEGSTSVTFQDTCLKEISIPILAIMNMLASGILLLVVALASAEIAPCPGDTRGDRRCNHDPTHRVCAKVRIYQLLTALYLLTIKQKVIIFQRLD